MRRMPDICFWVSLNFVMSLSYVNMVTDYICGNQIDIVDYNEPTMLIVGSRGVSQLKGYVRSSMTVYVVAYRVGLYRILLGSTSHYLIEVIVISLRRL